MNFFLMLISTVLAIALDIGGAAYAFDDTSVSGAVTCTSTVLVKSSATASGAIALVADGQGNYVSGSESYQLVGGGGCDYVLDNGTYQVNPDGTGESTTDWLLVKDSSSHGCTRVVRGTSSVFSLLTNTFTADLHASPTSSATL
jgi:hypothetical protein